MKRSYCLEIFSATVSKKRLFGFYQFYISIVSLHAPFKFFICNPKYIKEKRRWYYNSDRLGSKRLGSPKNGIWNCCILHDKQNKAKLVIPIYVNFKLHLVASEVLLFVGQNNRNSTILLQTNTYILYGIVRVHVSVSIPHPINIYTLFLLAYFP